MIVVLDPGHAGCESGAVGPTKTKEADIAVQIAKRVEGYLKPVCNVVLTRRSTTSQGLTTSQDLRARCIVSNKAGATCFISIHCNAFSNPSAHGTETLYYSAAGKRLSEGIQNRLFSSVALTNRGVKRRTDLYVLRNTNAVASLVEVAFISNPQEEALLKTADFQNRAAWAIASGIASYLGLSLTG